MVKPRQPVKLSMAARASVMTATAKKSAAGTTAMHKDKSIFKVELLPTCVDYGTDIGNDFKALQCELRSTDAWKCAYCLGLSDDM